MTVDADPGIIAGSLLRRDSINHTGQGPSIGPFQYHYASKIAAVVHDPPPTPPFTLLTTPHPHPTFLHPSHHRAPSSTPLYVSPSRVACHVRGRLQLFPSLALSKRASPISSTTWWTDSRAEQVTTNSKDSISMWSTIRSAWAWTKRPACRLSFCRLAGSPSRPFPTLRYFCWTRLGCSHTTGEKPGHHARVSRRVDFCVVAGEGGGRGASKANDGLVVHWRRYSLRP